MQASFGILSSRTITNGFLRSVTLDQPASDLSDFPILISGTYTYLKTVANGGKVQNSNGYDIRFYSDSALTTLLKFERVTWNGSTGEIEFWVKIPTLTSASATVIYITYGDSSFTTDAQDINNTWNSNFKSVWHLGTSSSVAIPVTSGNFRTTTVTGTAISATASAWDNSIRGEPGNVLYDPGNPIGGNYLYVFTGYAGSYTQGQTYLGFAYSSDGVSWTKYASNPVALPSNVYIEDPYIVKFGSTYYLYGEDAPNINIKLFTSTDLINWTAQGSVLSGTPAEWDSSWVGSPIVWKEGSTWYMLYEGSAASGQLGLATSSDGISWIKEASNPVFAAGDTIWASGAVGTGDIYKSGGTYYHLYIADTGASFKTGLATSTDLINWTDNPNNPIANSVSMMYLDGAAGTFIQCGPTGASETNVYLANGSAGSYYDSTSNGTNLTNNGASDITGIIGLGQDFDGSSDYVSKSTLSFNMTSSCSFSWWFKLDSQPGVGAWFRVIDHYGGAIASSSPYGYLMGYINNGGTKQLAFFYGTANGTTGGYTVNQTLSNSTWYHIAMVHDNAADTDTLYVNGSSIGTGTGKTENPASKPTSPIFLMSEDGTGKFVDGILDETHISDSVRNATWIATEYSNQNDPANFYIIGTETNA